VFEDRVINLCDRDITTAAMKSRERGEIFTFLLAVSNAVTCKIPKMQQASLF
jgi:hypothetical protein